MSPVDQATDAVKQLSDEQLTAFRVWFAEFDARAWDEQFESDVLAGRLDWLLEEAKQELTEGRCTER